MLAALMLMAVAAAPPAPIKLAAPGLTVVNVAPELQGFVGDHLAQQLVLRGLEVTTASQIAAVMGLERQKQLMGCNETSCVAELAGALGVDGLLLGSLAKLGDTLQLDVRVVSARDARNLAVYSARASEQQLLDALGQAAASLAAQLATGLQRPLVPATDVAARPAVFETRNTSTREVGTWMFLGATAALVVGVVLAVVDGQLHPADSNQVGPAGITGGVLIIGGGAGLLIGGVLYLVGGTERVPVRAMLVPTRAGVRLSFGWGW